MTEDAGETAALATTTAVYTAAAEMRKNLINARPLLSNAVVVDGETVTNDTPAAAAAAFRFLLLFDCAFLLEHV